MTTVKQRTRNLLRRLADLPRVVVDHFLPEDAGPSVDAPGEATVVVEHNITVGPRLRQFTAGDEADDDLLH